VDFPHVLVFDAADSEDAAAAELARQLKVHGVAAPLVLTNVHGARVAAQIEGPVYVATPVAAANQQWAADLGSRARRSGADAIVAVGGGRCLDVAKLSATRAGLSVIAVPTQLSHDGICSPVAVVPDGSGRAESVGAVAPRIVFVSLPTLRRAPAASVAAGLGDLIANPLALRDWALATERGLEDTDQRAWDLSVESFQLIEPHLDTGLEDSLGDIEFLHRLADSLVLSGYAMLCAGTSRPASGGEHEISHAIDEMYGGRALHGAQVAFGCVVSVALYGEDPHRFRLRLERLGLPQHPKELGLERDDVVALLLHAPETRPGRFTILEDADLDTAKARSLVDQIWDDL
jgi:glycerol-1-phosphate dehydrogenase [NAD(P)+]